MMPGSHDQEDLVVALVQGLDRLVDGDGTVDVFLVPEAVHQHHGHLQRLLGEDPVHRLVAPERVVARMLQHLPPEPHLLQPAPPPQLPRRPRLKEHVVVVVVARPPLDLRLPVRLLAVDVGHHLLPERAVVEPVVPLPAVHHRVHRHRHLQGRMRIHERHERQEPVVGDPEYPHPPVALRHVLHQPIDRVVRVGRVIHGRRILRPAQGPVHHVVPLGPVLPSHVLHHPDVPALDDHLRRVVVPAQDRPQVRALRMARQARRVVGRPRQEDRRPLGAFRDEDHRVQLHPVAHGDHHVPPDVVEAVGHRHELGRGLAGESWILGPRRGDRLSQRGRNER